MTVVLSTLPNGLRVVSDDMPHLETVSLGVWVAAGARHETEAEHGLSHFLEHMAFKGTANRTARRIAEDIESVGGDLNAATGAETTAYYARVLRGDEGLALGLLADILLNSLFDEVEFNRERQVILQEIAAIRDSPEDIANDLLHEAAYPDQPAGRPIIGTPESVSALKTADLRAFLAARYSPRDMIVAAAGAICHESLVGHTEALFGGLTDRPSGVTPKARYVGGTRSWDRRFEQCHVALGFEAPSYLDDRSYAAQVLSGLLGGGTSSRLFQEVRERRGLAYAIYSSAWGLKDTGMLGIGAATGIDALPSLIEVVARELDAVATSKPTTEEVARAKAQLKSGLMMALESSAARAERMARQLFAFGRLVPTSEILERIEAVTPDDIRDLATSIFAARSSIALVGAGRKSRKFAADAERMIRGLAA